MNQNPFSSSLFKSALSATTPNLSTSTQQQQHSNSVFGFPHPSSGVPVGVFGASPSPQTVFGASVPSKTNAMFGSTSGQSNVESSVFGGVGVRTSIDKEGQKSFGSFAAPAPVFSFGSLPQSQQISDSQEPANNEDARNKRFSTQNNTGKIREELKKQRDAREDAYYKNYKPVSLNEARSVTGTCPDMCPEFERYDREVTQELHFFEMLSGTEKDPVPRVDHRLAVKKYRRSAAGKDPEIFPEDIRSPDVLMKTMDYLMHNIVDRTDVEYLEIYNFVRDRVRAIRKDFKVQNALKGPICVSCLEKTTRFLIYSDFVLCELPESKYSWSQNRHQLVDTLTTLMQIYDEDSKERMYYDNEAEFRAYYILMMLDDNLSIDKFHVWLPNIQQHSFVQESLQIHRLYQNGLIERLLTFVISGSLGYLHVCIIHSVINKIRFDGLRSVLFGLGIKERKLSLSQICTMFLFSSEIDAAEYCRDIGAEILPGNPAEVKFDLKDALEYPKIQIKKNKFVLDLVPHGKVGDFVSAKQLPRDVQFVRKIEPVIMPELPKIDYEKLKMEKAKFKEEQAQTISNDILNSEVNDLMQNIVSGCLQSRKLFLASAFVCSSAILEEVTKHELSSILSDLIRMSRLKQSLARIELQQIVDKVVVELLWDISMKQVSEIKFIHLLKYRFFHSWKRFHRYRVHERKRIENIRQAKLKNLRDIPMLPNEMPIMTSEYIPPFTNDDVDESYNSAADCFPLAISIKMKMPNSFMKINVIQNSSNIPSHNHITNWFRTKLFGKDFYPEKYPFIYARSDLPNSNSYRNLLIANQINTNALEIIPEQAISNGTNICIFHLILGENDYHALQTLFESLKHVPKNLTLQILVFYWTFGSLRVPEIDTRSLSLHNPFCSVKFCHLGNLSGVLNERDVLRSVRISLEDAVEWIWQPPELANPFDWFQNDISPLFQTHVFKVASMTDEYLRRNNFDGISSHLLDLIKLMISRMRSVSTEKNLQNIPWPFHEKVKTVDDIPEPGWNTKERLERIDCIFEAVLKNVVFHVVIENMMDLRHALDFILSRIGSRLIKIEDDGLLFEDFFSITWTTFLQILVEAIRVKTVSPPCFTLKSELDKAKVAIKYDLARSKIPQPPRKRMSISPKQQMKLIKRKR